MSDAIWIAIIGAIGAVVVSRINTAQNRRLSKSISEVKEHSAATLEQVQNSHSRNLRDDLDRLHDEVVEGFKRQEVRQDSASTTIARLDGELKHQRERLDGHIDKYGGSA